jgi:acyl-CoA synthetase (AMP-forming)/AMP-acid ligase II
MAAGEDIRWDETTIPRTLRRAAERFGGALALDDEGVRFSFRELAAAGEAAARAFLAAGLAPGERAAIWAPNVWEWVVAALGIQSAGGVLVPLNTRYKAAEAGYILRKSRARVLCTMGEFLGTSYADSLAGEELPHLERVVVFRGAARRGEPWAEFVAAGARVPADEARARAAAVAPGDLSDILFTSGTTGNPKGVMTAHGQNLKVFDTWSRGVGVRAGDRYLIVGPFFHSFGYKAGWLACLIRGAAAIPHQVFDAGKVMERIARERINVLPGAPTIYHSMLAHPDFGKHDLSSLRLAVTGAAPVPVELVKRMRAELGFESVITAYGLTECCGTVSMCLPGDDPETIATTAGRALPDTEVRCVDEDGKEAPRGTPGEIRVRGYNVMRGYFEDPAETAKTIDAEGWLHTGDVGVMDERGYLRITDRIKDMFITGGFNCYPAEIENLMYRHPGIAQVAVIGVPDERMGEVGMAFVVPRPGATLDPAALVAWCRAEMANFKVPRRIEIVDALPTNASGKVLKYELRRRSGDVLQDVQKFGAPERND